METEATAPPAQPAADAARVIPRGYDTGTIMHRSAGRPTSYDARARRFDAVLSAGSPVRRWFGTEVLSMDPGSVDLSRVVQGQVRFLDHHNAFERSAVLGVVESVRFENGTLIGHIRLAETDEARAAEGMIARGELTGISIGYRAGGFRLVAVDEDDNETWEITRWELLEASLVSVPADPVAQVRGLGLAANRAPARNSETDMAEETLRSEAAGSEPAASQSPTPAVAGDALAADRRRAGEITMIGTRAGFGGDDIQRAIESGESVEQFRRRAFDRLAAANPPSIAILRDEGDTRRADMQDALTLRLQASSGERVEASAGARRYMGVSLSEMAAEAIGQRSAPRTAADREDVFRRAFHSTSDFPVILAGAMNARLLANYQTAPAAYRQIARRTSFADFRAHDQIRPSDFPMLQPVTEAGEVKAGVVKDGKKESVRVESYGVRFNLTRQLLVNDNLGAIEQILAQQGVTVALFEDKTFFSMKGTIGPVLNEDAKAVYHADHGNLAASGTAISTASLGVGRTALRKMKRLDGEEMGLAPAVLLVGPDKETEAEMVLAQVLPAQANQVNLFSGRLRVVQSARMAGNAWELYADPALGSNWTWGLLDGFEAPRVQLENVMGVDGVSFQLLHDFGCGAVDFRYGYRNPGA